MSDVSAPKSPADGGAVKKSVVAGKSMSDPGKSMSDPGKSMSDPGKSMPDPSKSMPDLGKSVPDLSKQAPSPGMAAGQSTADKNSQNTSAQVPPVVGGSSLDFSYPSVGNGPTQDVSPANPVKEEKKKDKVKAKAKAKAKVEDMKVVSSGKSVPEPAAESSGNKSSTTEEVKMFEGSASENAAEDLSSAQTEDGKKSSLLDLAKKLSGWKKDDESENISSDAPVNESVTKSVGTEPAVVKPSVGVEPVPAPKPAIVAKPAVAAKKSMPGLSGKEPAAHGSDAVTAKTVAVPESVITKPVAAVEALVTAKSTAVAGPVKPISETISNGTPTGAGAQSKPAGKFPFTIQKLLQMVIEKDASDLHIAVGYPAMVRIDGVLQPVSKDIVGENDVSDLVLPTLDENKKELLEVNREVDLAYSLGDAARFRINAYYEKCNIAAAFRLIPNKIRSIEELKLPGVYHQLSKLNQGLVLVTGPTGHGKSTTLAAIIQEVNMSYGKHIITIEDPIEYIYPKGRALVNQREMHEDTHSWEIALRSAMREDPDVILVGEMRDYETIAAAITLAETGHLVLATLHTNNAAQTIDRIIDVFPEHQQPQVRTQLSNILESVLSQRLIPMTQGGRRAASEIMLCTPAIRNLIREGKTYQVDNVIRTSLDIGMKSLEQSLVELVREGVITVENAETYAVHQEEVVRLLK
ncbi:MAG: PilT/PilU family type 4a pilus ATPase [Patescibacteria group bacterium]|nr:PilT/PilU family type 4a pilus ATPase [Patescibacteria group bacterium]